MTGSTHCKIYTDGAARGNPGIGGWGFVLYDQNDRKVFGMCGVHVYTTNNRMELIATIKALEHSQNFSDRVIVTDSQYVKNGITTWIHGWKENGWKTSQRKPVKNQDLWQELDRLSARFSVQWKWVRGHSGDHGNEEADALCNRAMDAYGDGILHDGQSMTL